jgi:predicted ATPase/class 3 adenylate cyclase
MQVSDPERVLPSGTVALLFTDIEGSSARWETHRDAMAQALERHDAVLRTALERHGGIVFKTVGDAFCCVFSTASDAIASAYEAQRAIAQEDFSSIGGLRVRMAVHTGPADVRAGDYFGPTINRVARLLSIGHGGQVLVSGIAKELAEGCMPPQATLRDLGAHRLKDLTHPEQVYQLIAPGLETDFPPLRSLEALPNNLPQQLTSFVGREADIAEIKDSLTASRLVTLVGAGGVGKTRLSIQVGADVLDRFEDGVWFAELAPLADSELVIATIASMFGVRPQSDQPLLDVVAAALRPKHALLILDNCEHVLDEVARIASTLLRNCPRLTILASSREGLGIEGESVLRVPSLSFPAESSRVDLQNAGEYGAVALFIDRAKAADRRFAPTDVNVETIAEICRQLDGIALAIELAAPRVKVLSVEQLATRLNERFRILTGGSRTALPRQQTMRALIDWSFDLLGENERTIFRRVAVFSGTFSIDAAGELCADERIEAWDVLDLLSSLVDKSLVASELAGSEQRYRMLVSTRQYALERLERDGELETMQRAHAEYYARLAQRAHTLYYTTPTRRWLDTLEPEIHNLRAAMDWTLASGEVELGVRIPGALLWYWAIGHRAGEAIARIQRALDASASLPDSADLARLHVAHAFALGNLNVYNEAVEAAKHAIEIAERLGDDEDLALGLMSEAAGNFTNAGYDFESVFARAASIWQKLGIRRMVGYATFLTARSHLVSRNAGEKAAPLYEQALNIARATGDERTMAVIFNNMAEWAFFTGDTAGAIRNIKDAIANFQRLPIGMVQVTNYCNLAAYLIEAGEYEEAVAALREGLRIARDTQATRSMRIAGTHCSAIEAASGNYNRAACLLGSAMAFYAEAGYSIEPTERRVRDKAVGILEPALGQERLDELMAEGASWEMERAVDEMRLVSAPAAEYSDRSRAAL